VARFGICAVLDHGGDRISTHAQIMANHGAIEFALFGVAARDSSGGAAFDRVRPRDCSAGISIARGLGDRKSRKSAQ